MSESQYEQRTGHGLTYFTRDHGTISAESPIVVAIHWLTGEGPVMDLVFHEMETPAHLVLPQAPHASGHEEGGYSWFTEGMAFYGMADAEQAPLIRKATDQVAGFINELKKTHTGQVIVVGMSQGGDLALHLAVYYPHLLEVAIPCAGRLTEPMRPPTISDTSPIIRMLLGAEDEVISVQSNEDARDWLKHNGFDVELDVYAGVGHEFSEAMIARIQTIIAGAN